MALDSAETRAVAEGETTPSWLDRNNEKAA
jgi:hypothetical protein